MTLDNYILDGHIPVIEPDLLKWAMWYETAERHVGHDDIGEFTVSTVFLGLDHQHWEGPPILFETMIFQGPPDENGYRKDVGQQRYSTWEQAETGHQKVVDKIRGEVQGEPIPDAFKQAFANDGEDNR